MAKKKEADDGPVETRFRIYYKVLRRDPITRKLSREAGPFDCMATSGLTAIDKAKAHVLALFGSTLVEDDGTHDDELKKDDVRLVGKKNEYKVI